VPDKPFGLPLALESPEITKTSARNARMIVALVVMG
jgi:hypothetical protein